MVKNQFFRFIIYIIILIRFLGCTTDFSANQFTSNWSDMHDRIWIGPEFWANPLQDWQLKNGRIECVVSGDDRNLFLLTRLLKDETGNLEMSVRLGRLDDGEPLTEGWIGFKIGVRGEFDDYRDNAVHGDGFPVGLTTGGQLFIGNLDSTVGRIDQSLDNIRLNLVANPEGDSYKVTLYAFDEQDKELTKVEKKKIEADWLTGGIALVCSWGEIPAVPLRRSTVESGNWGLKSDTKRGGNVRFWFADWKVSGSKVQQFPERTFGPILFSQYTLSKDILKLTVQMAPVGEKDNQSIQLQVKKENKWKTVGEAVIDQLARTATFRVTNWDFEEDISYRLVCNMNVGKGQEKIFFREGIIRKEPWDKDEIVIAGFTGNNDLGFPNNELVQAIKYHNPDVLFFSGDQIYEGVGGYGIQTKPLEKAALDYLRKWYLYGWAYGDLMRDRPTIAIPDDHDVYHGNIWGAGGIPIPPGTSGAEAQDAGGYKMEPEWVNMVQRTQTSHLPDPYDPAPVEQGIGVYYCDFNYAGVSFAIIEDRKFKSAPKQLLPRAKVHNGWAQNLEFNAAKEGDVPGAILLGDRQLSFLENWTMDWSNKTWMKIVLSQTIFANMATLPKENSHHDNIVPSLKIFEIGEYPPDDVPVSDMDSNGWPQTGRNKALCAIRKGFAFHLAGDQHLGSTIQYGIEKWRDAGFAFCVPAISNIWPRRWFPAKEGENRQKDRQHYTGDFEDGFGNKMTVFAVSNPYFTGKKPSRLYDRATGYGIVRLNRISRDITFECWPRWVDPSERGAKNYFGWPIRIKQMDNYGRKAVAYLPTLKIQGLENPVVHIVDEIDGQTIYTLRITGASFRPNVFRKGYYTVIVEEPDLHKFQMFKNIHSIPENDDQTIQVIFNN
jgi:hypothetical protein